MRLGQTSAIYLASRIVASTLGFVGTIYFTRTLGEEVYGFYSITLALVSWLGIVKSAGFGEAIVKRMSEGEEPDAYLVAGTVIKATLTVPIIIGVFVFREQVNAYVGQPVAEFVGLLLMVTILSGIVNSALKGRHLVHVYSLFHTTKMASKTVAMIALVFVGWGLTGMLFGYVVGSAVVALIGLWIVKPTFTVPRRKHFVRLFDFAKYSWMGNLRGKTFRDVDILVLGLFTTAGLTGVYAVAYSLVKFLDIFGNAIKTTLFPEMSKRSASGETDVIARLTNDAFTYAGLFLIPGIVGGTILGDRLMRIYGSGFAIGAEVLPILLVGILAYSYTKQLLNTLNGIDRPDLAFRANAVFISSNLVLNLTLVYTIGWVGAAIATATSAGIGLLFGFHYTRKHVAFTVPYGEIARQWTAALGMGLVIYVARAFGEARWAWIPDYNAVFVVGLVGLGAAMYFTLLFGISREFRTTIANNLPFDVPLLGDR